MAREQPGSLIRHIRQMAGAAGVATDRELLGRFVEHQDEAAFDGLIQRHGPMVWGVCRRILHREQDAEDAFQATFLVLARQAASQQWQDSIRCWLFGVARRAALKARSRSAKEAPRNQTAEAVDPVDPLSNLTARELFSSLDEEMERLPEQYRVVLILCCLDGKSRDEAARELNCSPGSIKGRLERGRELLQHRLAKRGLPLAAALAATLWPTAVSAAPPHLVAMTIQSGLHLAAGKVLAEAAASQAVELANIVAQSMIAGKATKVLISVVAFGLLLLGGAYGLILAGGTPKEPVAQQSAPPRLPEPHKKESTQDPLPLVVPKEPNPLDEKAAAPIAPPVRLQADLKSLDSVARKIIVIVRAGGGDDKVGEGKVNERAFSIAADAAIKIDGNPATLNDLRKGHRLTLVVAATANEVTSVTVISRKNARPEKGG